jgi:hypothetical protein|tara:strand:- start:5040 stop:5351 length:312 start_codon:yes stop_codon:yes gene_type:complete
MKLSILCRIDKSYFNSDYQKHYTIVSTPAPDQFSMPSTFRLSSDSSLGSVGDTIEAEVQLSGYVKQEKYTDKATGEKKEFTRPVTYLNVGKFKKASLPIKEAS